MTAPYWSNGVATLYQADARAIPLPDGSVHCVVTSPPYFGLRDYNLSEWVDGDPECVHKGRRVQSGGTGPASKVQNGHKGSQGDGIGPCLLCGATQQAAGIGLEPTLSDWLANIVAVSREVWRVLRDDGTYWLNLGDSYAGSGKGPSGSASHWTNRDETLINGKRTPRGEGSGRWGMGDVAVDGLTAKNLMGQPWRAAFALQEDGAASVTEMYAIRRAIDAIWDAYDGERPPDKVLTILERMHHEYVQAKGNSWYLRSAIVWHKCLSGGAWLYAKTQKGVGPHMVKDLVRLDPATVQLWNGARWTQVASWAQAEQHNPGIEITLRSGERIGATPDHRWPTNRGLVSTAELAVGDILDTCQLPDGESTPPWLIDDALWFAGLYLAEGSMSGNTIQLAGHVKETARWTRVQRLCAHYGAVCRLYEYGNTQHIHIDKSAGLRAVLATILGGRVAKDKHLTAEVWNWGNAALEQIASGYLEGDGHIDGDRIRLGFTRNYALERDIRTLAARLGATLTLKLSTATNQDGTFPAYNGEWRWQASEHRNALQRSEIMALGKSKARKFWDIAVADDPHTFALASGVLTHNSNPMPESVSDRPTSAYEMVFLLTKRAHYFYDADAVREPQTQGTIDRFGNGGAPMKPSIKEGGSARKKAQFLASTPDAILPNGRNARNVWTIPTQGRPEAHFATFPDELPRRCILAGTSEHGVCAECGAPWERQTEQAFAKSQVINSPRQDGGDSNGRANNFKRDGYGAGSLTTQTVGWQPTCDCNAADCPQHKPANKQDGHGPRHAGFNARWKESGGVQPKATDFQPTCTCDANRIPATVLDPFIGSGTTVAVAQQLGRHGIGLDLNPDYLAIARRRLEGITLPMAI